MKIIIKYILFIAIITMFNGCYYSAKDNQYSRELNKIMVGKWNITELTLFGNAYNPSQMTTFTNKNVGTLDIRNNIDEGFFMYNFIYSEGKNIKTPLSVQPISYPVSYYLVEVEYKGPGDYYSSSVSNPYQMKINDILQINNNEISINFYTQNEKGVMKLIRF